MSDFDSIFTAKESGKQPKTPKGKAPKVSDEKPKKKIKKSKGSKSKSSHKGFHKRRPGKSSAEDFKGQVFYVPFELLDKMNALATKLSRAGTAKIDASDIAIVAITQYLKKNPEASEKLAQDIANQVDSLIEVDEDEE
ncbi:MAG: hypothetical protein AAGA83_00240 [Cyanobacteria bacterium P01_F01_bin.116]